MNTLAIRPESPDEPRPTPGPEREASSALLLLCLTQPEGSVGLLADEVLDEMLHLGVDRIRSALRSDDPCSRISPDQVAITLHRMDAASVAAVAKRLVDLVQRTYVIRGGTVYLCAHVGVAWSPRDGAEPCALMRQARIALRRAKASHVGAIVWFEKCMETGARVQQRLTDALRRALPLRQLEVVYQPQVDLPDQQLTGFEALLRWHHPDLGWISPGEFIPLAEEVGLISAFGGWVLRTACRQMMELPPSIAVAVNASPLQLRDASLLPAVSQALAISGLHPSRLEIEITEGVLLDRSENVRQTLDGLRRLGVRLAIDDFGTGYSSLGQLATLPFNRIKIDRSLVGTGEKNRVITRAITMLGQGLDMSTLIEGIETEDALASAISDGCTSAQGYLFGSAISARHLQARVREVQTNFFEAHSRSPLRQELS